MRRIIFGNVIFWFACSSLPQTYRWVKWEHCYGFCLGYCGISRCLVGEMKRCGRKGKSSCLWSLVFNSEQRKCAYLCICVNILAAILEVLIKLETCFFFKFNQFSGFYRIYILIFSLIFSKFEFKMIISQNVLVLNILYAKY
jgi:hypothetical protein